MEAGDSQAPVRDPRADLLQIGGENGEIHFGVVVYGQAAFRRLKSRPRELRGVAVGILVQANAEGQFLA